MTTGDAKRQIILRLDALSEKQYEAVEKCMTQGSRVLLTEGMSERYQIRLNLTEALEQLWEECQKGGEDFEKMVRAWQGCHRGELRRYKSLLILFENSQALGSCCRPSIWDYTKNPYFRNMLVLLF